MRTYTPNNLFNTTPIPDSGLHRKKKDWKLWTVWTSLQLSLLFLFIFIPFAEAAGPTYVNSIGMEFTFIPAGTFVMGTEGNSSDVSADEIPAHSVSITRALYLGTYEVTQAQWERVMGNNPSEFKGESNPVDNISWEDAQEFIRRLNDLEGFTRYRLPTEAEWEYAARGGTHSAYFFGNDASSIIFYAWYNYNSGGSSHAVGQKKANALGLHDMLGNVSEWVQDAYDATYYAQSPAKDPTGPSFGQHRVARGGNWCHGAAFCRSAQRFHFAPNERSGFIGLRVLRETK